MEIISRPFNGENYWNKKGYELLNGETEPRRKIKVVHVSGDGEERRRRRRRQFWRLKKTRKVMIITPKKLWRKFREGYVGFMLRLAGNVDGENEITGKVRKIAPGPAKSGVADFERRLVLEIYKSLATSRGVSEF